MSLAPRTLSLSALLALALLAGCDSSDSFTPSPCDVSLHQLKPSAALVGEELTASGRPFTSAYDTAVYVGTARATVLSVDRYRCEPCDDCLEEQGCTGCDDCDSCDWICSNCMETVRFAVPEVAPGELDVKLFNRHGESNPLPVLIEAPEADTAEPDTASDSQPTDSASDDTASDTGVGDSDPDSGGQPADTGATKPTDTSSQETGSEDTGAGSGGAR